jgi:uncharacterized protein
VNEPPKAAPVTLSERIPSIDVLRGFAVLGILIMNIQSFSMIGAAYFNPTAYGDLSGVNWWTWLLCHIFADQKFMTIFSILFGAGIVLMTGRAEAKGASPARVHYRRTFWLIVFGLLHAYLLWFGDILYAYGMCALVAYLFRRRSPVTLLILGILSIAVCSLLYLFFAWSAPFWPAGQLEATTNEMWSPDAETTAREVAAYSGSYLEQMKYRVPGSAMMQTFVFLVWSGWRAGGLFLIGMALYKWGVLSARRSNLFYIVMTVAGLCAGIPVVLYGVKQHIAHGWSFVYSFYVANQFNYWGSLFVSAGYIGLAMLLVRVLRENALLSSMAKVGRMAFSNYILQSLICTTLFYGHGFGLFGSVPRWGQILIVLAIWIVLVIFSNLWLRRFRFGPMEWLWRTLTYWKAQGMRKIETEAEPAG